MPSFSASMSPSAEIPCAAPDATKRTIGSNSPSRSSRRHALSAIGRRIAAAFCAFGDSPQQSDLPLRRPACVQRAFDLGAKQARPRPLPMLGPVAPMSRIFCRSRRSLGYIFLQDRRMQLRVSLLNVIVSDRELELEVPIATQPQTISSDTTARAAFPPRSIRPAQSRPASRQGGENPDTVAPSERSSERDRRRRCLSRRSRTAPRSLAAARILMRYLPVAGALSKFAKYTRNLGSRKSMLSSVRFARSCLRLCDQTRHAHVAGCDCVAGASPAVRRKGS